MQLEKLHCLKPSYVLCLFSGALVMLGFSTLRGSSAQPSNHVYELRLYHVNEGKMDALIARFGDHTDAIFRATQYEEHWLLASGRRAVFAEPLCVHPRAPEPRGSPEELGCVPGRSGMEKGKGRL